VGIVGVTNLGKICVEQTQAHLTMNSLLESYQIRSLLIKIMLVISIMTMTALCVLASNDIDRNGIFENQKGMPFNYELKGDRPTPIIVKGSVKSDWSKLFRLVDLQRSGTVSRRSELFGSEHILR